MDGELFLLSKLFINYEMMGVVDYSTLIVATFMNISIVMVDLVPGLDLFIIFHSLNIHLSV